MPEIVDSIKPYVFDISSYTYIPVIKFNLEIRHSTELTTIPNNKIEEL